VAEGSGLLVAMTGDALKVAVTFLAAVMATSHAFVPPEPTPEQSPDHPINTTPLLDIASGVGIRVTMEL
jgi:hypothetical protein